MHNIVGSHRFAFLELLLVFISGVVGMLKPEMAFWCLPALLLVWICRVTIGQAPFRRTPFDLLLLLFIITAGIGYLVAYDQAGAASKLYFIVISILLYFVLAGQPKRNLPAVAAVFLLLGVSVCLYYFLTHNAPDYAAGNALIRDLEGWRLKLRSELGWSPIPSGYVSGLAIVSTSLMMYCVMISRGSFGRWQKLAIYSGFGIVVLTIISIQSASFAIAFLGAVGAWVLSRLTLHKGLRKKGLFSWMLLLYIGAVAVAVCLFDPAASASLNQFGTNSRTEVFLRSLYFVGDFPFSGGGLASFPGLYSQYMLVIPFFYFSNSYNLFLDVAIEQGLVGSLVLLSIYLISIVRVSIWMQLRTRRRQAEVILFVLVFTFVHALMQDYLYNAAGTALLLLPVAIALTLEPRWVVARVRRRIFSPPVWSATARIFAVSSLGFALIVLSLNLDAVRSIWYSNRGAVQMAKVELAGFPEAGWLGTAVFPRLGIAEDTLKFSLQLDPHNVVANYRLGLIYLYGRDFQSASKYLEFAYKQAPSHRGVKKSLGYSYLWLGEMDKARGLLGEMPEVKDELDAYFWWWTTQGRDDLARQAYQLSSLPIQTQP